MVVLRNCHLFFQDVVIDLCCYLRYGRHNRKLDDSTLGPSGPLGHPTTSVATRKIVAATMAGNQNYPGVGTGLCKE
ncbi:hypothetical protein C5167_013951 [Papaver somniferum]|uniref:Uncharacterized protein n=1 Tax=Papaver somniferum TaxID=3469 RepID=A0A4Y7J5S0_PAPSO|nr:hypothetical protein C5167_013951 [Papaver somniferum]